VPLDVAGGASKVGGGAAGRLLHRVLADLALSQEGHACDANDSESLFEYLRMNRALATAV
jgi:hypothetical protein